MGGASLIDVATCLALVAESCWASFGRHASGRTGLRVVATDVYDVWLLSWPAETEISPHHHGDSDVAFAVAAAPMVLPLAYGGPLPSFEQMPPPMQAAIMEMRGRTAGAFALRVYDQQRSAL